MKKEALSRIADIISDKINRADTANGGAVMREKLYSKVSRIFVFVAVEATWYFYFAWDTLVWLKENTAAFVALKGSTATWFFHILDLLADAVNAGLTSDHLLVVSVSFIVFYLVLYIQIALPFVIWRLMPIWILLLLIHFQGRSIIAVFLIAAIFFGAILTIFFPSATGFLANTFHVLAILMTLFVSVFGTAYVVGRIVAIYSKSDEKYENSGLVIGGGLGFFILFFVLAKLLDLGE